MLEELAQEVSGTFTVGKVDLQKDRQLGGRYHVRSIPTLIVFKNGREVERVSGFRSKADMKQMLLRHSSL